ncbi:hypothetical protein A5714_01545 [Mycobacterium sp. E2462]|uniref:esterase n=1 Tax=Mycobacterium sp. E2462 TaxID=1834133 RepID=UPI0007FD1A78|nr:esterase [Mycobacterium sp. E2462]OBI11878.1 hypothetical protein A5714_01545 [Mycobacterium sp. E2462]
MLSSPGRRARRTTATAAALGMLAVFAGPPVAGADAPLCSPASVDADQMCHFEASGPGSDVTMVFPANYPDEPALIAYLTKVDNDYTGGRGAVSTGQPPTALKVTGSRYSSGAAQTGTQSVVTEIYQNMGGAHPLTWYKSFNYNAATRQVITFDSLFKAGTQPLPAVLPIVQKTLTDRYGPAVSIPPDTGLQPANYQSFAITDDAIVFFFDQNSLQPALEATQVSVPRSAVASMLSPGLS